MKRCAPLLLLVALGVLVPAVALRAATFYVDPATGSMANDGSAARPWRTLQEVFSYHLIQSRNAAGTIIYAGAPVKAGDTILLRSGYHGDISISGYHNDSTITVAAEPGQFPELRRLYLTDCVNWEFGGCAISTELSPTFARLSGGLVSISTCSYITIRDCLVYSVADITGYTATDWLNNTCNGISTSATSHHISILDNIVRNIAFGINISGTDTLVRGNQVINFRGDGMRALNDNLTFEYNTIKNAFKVDDNHDDGIQVYKTGVVQGLVQNMVVRGNTIIGAEDPGQPLQTTLQGMGMFEGPHQNFRIENNLVITNHWHGITLYWGIGCTIINNTCYNTRYIAGSSTMTTWIEIGAAKSSYGGALSQNCRIANNLAHRFNTGGNVNLTYQNNMTITRTNYATIFTDPQNGDFTLRPDSPALDAGSSVDAPSIDILGNPRPTGAGWDLGAYELAGPAGPPGPPVANAGADRTVVDTDGNGYEAVTLDGAGSYCSGGEITSWTWKDNGSIIATGATPQVNLTVGVHSIILYVTNNAEPPEEHSDTVVITVADSQPVTSSLLWQNFPIEEQAATFTIEFDAQPGGSAIDGVFGLSDGDADWYTDLAPIFRFNTNGYIDARNGAAYAADVSAPYAASAWYHVRMIVNVATRRYSVYVTPFGGTEIALATNYAFRTEQAAVTRLNRWSIVETGAGGHFTVKAVELIPPATALTIERWALAADHGPAGVIARPVTDNDVESRLGGPTSIRVAFNTAVNPSTLNTGSVTVVGAASGDVSALVGSLSLDAAGRELTISLLGPLPDADRYTVTVTSVVRAADGGAAVSGDPDIVVGVLAGDVDGSGSVTAADMTAIRAEVGNPVAPGTAQYDIDGSGGITSADQRAVRTCFGHVLP